MSQYKKMFLFGAFATYLCHFIQIGSGLLLVPLTLNYFGVTRYGIYALIMAMLAYLSNANFGIPSAVTILVAKRTEYQSRLKIIVLSFIAMVFICSGIIALIFFVDNNLNWQIIFGDIKKENQEELSMAAICAACFYLSALPFSVFQSFFLGIHKVYVERVYGMINQVIPLLSIIIAERLGGDLVTFFVFRGSFLLCVNIVATLHFLLENRKIKRSSDYRDDVNKRIFEFNDLTKELIVTSWRLFWIGLAGLVVWSTDNFIISHFVGIEEVASYAITSRFITFTLFFYTAFNLVLTPMYGTKYSEGDVVWVQERYNAVLELGARISGLVWIGIMLYSKMIILLWTGQDMFAGMMVAFSLGLYGYFLSMVHTHSSLYNGLNFMQLGIAISWSEALLNFALSLVFVNYWGSGGVALGTSLASLMTVFWMLPFEIKKRSNGQIFFLTEKVAKHALFLISCVLISIYLIHLNLSIGLELALGVLILLIYTYFSLKTISKSAKMLMGSLIEGKFGVWGDRVAYIFGISSR